MEENNKTLIIYHKEDNDGLFSCALIYNYLVYELQYEKEDIVCVGLDYSLSSKIKRKDIKEWSKIYANMFITDFSLSISLMKYAFKLWGDKFIWFDHHAPIIKAANETNLINCAGIRDTSMSAILLAYTWLYDSFSVKLNTERESIPLLLRILSAWDSFTYEKEGFELDYVRKVNYGITHIFKLNLFDIARILKFNTNDETQKLINKAYSVGTILIDNENYRMSEIIANCGDKEWTLGDSNRPTVAIFMQGPTNSQMFKSVMNECSNAAVFKRNRNGTWAVSLYNIDENDKSFHCGEYCRKIYKGGGHIGAAGFSIKQSKMINMLRTKHI